MINSKWNRRIKNMQGTSNSPQSNEYKIARVRPKKRKKRHPGYTIMPEHTLWIFEKNK